MRYWVDLNGTQFTDGEASPTSGWIQAMPYGSYQHPLYGKIDFTPETAAKYADNVNKGIRGQDLDIDYDHKAKDGGAAGWVKQAEARDNGLWILVEWTKDAAEKIRNKVYRYFSPEFVDKWTHPKTQEVHKNVLFGGALTNRPFLKDILPINLNEVVEDNTMDEATRKQWALVLGLDPEKATEAEVNEALTNYKQPAKPSLASAKVEKQDDGTYKIVADGFDGEVVVKPDTVAVPASDPSDNEIKKLAESHPAIAKMLADNEATKARLREVEVANRLSEVNGTLDKIGDGKKKLPPAVADKFRKAMLSAPKSLSDDFAEGLKLLSDTGFVDTTQKSSTDPAKLGEHVIEVEDGDTVVTKFLSEIDSTMAEKKVDYREAVELVRSAQPKLFDEYMAVVDGNEVTQ